MNLQKFLSLRMIAAFLLLTSCAQGDDVFDSVARETLARNGQQREQYETALKALRDAQGKVNWAEAGFQDMRNVRSPYEGNSNSLDRMMNQQRLALQRLTTLPVYQVRHEIDKGEGINRLLDILGPVAAEQERRLQRLEAIAAGDLSEADRKRREFLIEFESDLLLESSLLDALTFETGISGARGTARITRDPSGAGVRVAPLPLSWPAVLRLARYQNRIKAVEHARDALLAEPKPKEKSEAELFRDLMTAIDQLTASFKVDYGDFLNPERGQDRRSEDKMAYLDGKRFLSDSLRPAAQRWQDEGRSSVPRSTWPFSRNCAKGKVSLIQVLAFLNDQGWRFPEAFESRAELGHHQVFEGCHRYYLKLASIKSILEPLQQDVAQANTELDKQQQILQQAMSGKVAAENAQAMSKIAEAGIMVLRLFFTN